VLPIFCLLKSQAKARVNVVINNAITQGNKALGNEKSGYLLKKSEGLRKAWQKRRCVISDGFLTMSHNNVSAKLIFWIKQKPRSRIETRRLIALLRLAALKNFFVHWTVLLLSELRKKQVYFYNITLKLTLAVNSVLTRARPMVLDARAVFSTASGHSIHCKRLRMRRNMQLDKVNQKSVIGRSYVLWVSAVFRFSDRKLYGAIQNLRNVLVLNKIDLVFLFLKTRIPHCFFVLILFSLSELLLRRENFIETQST